MIRDRIVIGLVDVNLSMKFTNGSSIGSRKLDHLEAEPDDQFLGAFEDHSKTNSPWEVITSFSQRFANYIQD